MNDPYSEEQNDPYRAPEIKPFVERMRSELDATPIVNTHGGIDARSQAPVIADMSEQTFEGDDLMDHSVGASQTSPPAAGGNFTVLVYTAGELKNATVIGAIED